MKRPFYPIFLQASNASGSKAEWHFDLGFSAPVLQYWVNHPDPRRYQLGSIRIRAGCPQAFPALASVFPPNLVPVLELTESRYNRVTNAPAQSRA